METCYKVVRSPLMKQMVFASNRFGFEPEITAWHSQANAHIRDLPVSYSGRTYEEGEKIGWQDGVAALRHAFNLNIVTPPHS